MLFNIFKFRKSSNHLLNLTLGLEQMLITPITSAIIVIMITLALFFTAALSLLQSNKTTIHNHWDASAQISIHLKKNIDKEKAIGLLQKLQQNPVVSKIELIQPNDGIKIFAEDTELKALLDNLKDNPLPNVIMIQPKVKILSKNIATQFIEELKKQPEITAVSADLEWLERSYNWLNLWDNSASILLFILIINLFLVITGIGYLAAWAFGTKHNIAKDILPYQFAWYGLIGAVMSIILVRSIVVILRDHDIITQGLNVGFGLLLILAGPLLGFIGTKITANKNG
jgi:cell division transport system permease protein